MCPQHHIIERVCAITFVGVGMAGLIWPSGVNSAVLPLLKDFVPLALMMLAMLAVGAGRVIAAEMFPVSGLPLRIALSGISLLIWIQWAIGLFESIPLMGVRPGMFHLAAMGYGEFALIYRLTRYTPPPLPALPSMALQP